MRYNPEQTFWGQFDTIKALSRSKFDLAYVDCPEITRILEQALDAGHKRENVAYVYELFIWATQTGKDLNLEELKQALLSPNKNISQTENYDSRQKLYDFFLGQGLLNQLSGFFQTITQDTTQTDYNYGTTGVLSTFPQYLNSWIKEWLLDKLNQKNKHVDAVKQFNMEIALEFGSKNIIKKYATEFRGKLIEAVTQIVRGYSELILGLTSEESGLLEQISPHKCSLWLHHLALIEINRQLSLVQETDTPARRRADEYGVTVGRLNIELLTQEIQHDKTIATKLSNKIKNKIKVKTTTLLEELRLQLRNAAASAVSDIDALRKESGLKKLEQHDCEQVKHKIGQFAWKDYDRNALLLFAQVGHDS